MEIYEETIQTLSAYLPRIIAAIVVLVLGWLLSWVISAVVARCLHRLKLDERISSGAETDYKAERCISRSLFWLLMLFVVIAFFSVLKLSIVSESLKNVLDQVLGFLPRVLAAGILFLIAWAIASAIKFVVSKVLTKTKLDERFSEQVEKNGQKQISMSKTLANTAYWLVFLLFLPAFLSALAMEGILDPVQQMVEKVVAFLPNVFVAGLILLVGWFLARVIRKITTNVLSAAGADKLVEKIGLKGVLKSISLSNILGLVVYVLILVPIVIAALDSLKLEGITEPASHMLETILAALPAIFSAVIVLIIAYVVGRLVGQLVKNILEGINFDAWPVKLGLGTETSEGKWKASEVVTHLVLVAIMLLASVSAFSLLGFEYLSELVSRLLVFIGHILMGLMIFALGLYIANLVAWIIKSRKVEQAALLAIFAKIAILVLAGAMALRQMGLANEIISLAFGLILGAAAVAAAIAFGIGGRNIAERKLGQWTKSIESEESNRLDSKSGKN